MIRRDEKCAICHKCGQPYKVVDLGPQAASLGLTIPESSFNFVFECPCGGSELTIDDDIAALELRELLLTYHNQGNSSS
jgi:hypothetical protein